MRKTAALMLSLLTMIFLLSGCEAFRKKFVRKSKKEKEVAVVVNTYEYESQYTVEQAYKRYYVFWSAAHEELIARLDGSGSRKKQVFAANNIVENLKHMRQYLAPEKQAELDKFIATQEDIRNQLDKYRLPLSQKLRIKNTLQAQGRRIAKQFSYGSIKEYLIEK